VKRRRRMISKMTSRSRSDPGLVGWIRCAVHNWTAQCVVAATNCLRESVLNREA
jgi:hypothetical protein